MEKTGVVYIVLGVNATREAKISIESLRRKNSDLTICTIGERIPGAINITAPAASETVKRSRLAKVSLYALSPFGLTLYLDADTRVSASLSPLYQILRDGWDITLSASKAQGNDLLWHIGEDDKQHTLETLGNPLPLQLQGGVIGFNRNDRVKKFFDVWREEWERYEGQDQGALLRALHRHPLRVWLLSNEWNGGGLIQHYCGKARDK